MCSMLACSWMLDAWGGGWFWPCLVRCCLGQWICTFGTRGAVPIVKIAFDAGPGPTCFLAFRSRPCFFSSHFFAWPSPSMCAASSHVAGRRSGACLHLRFPFPTSHFRSPHHLFTTWIIFFSLSHRPSPFHFFQHIHPHVWQLFIET